MNIFKKLNQTGFAHVVAVAVVVVGLAAVGTYFLVASHAATCVDFSYKQGSKGSCVSYIQTLADHKTVVSPKLAITGKYDKLVAAGVTQIQTAYNLSYAHATSGVVDQPTWQELCDISTSPGVTAAFTADEQNAWNNAGCSKFLSTSYTTP